MNWSIMLRLYGDRLQLRVERLELCYRVVDIEPFSNLDYGSMWG